MVYLELKQLNNSNYFISENGRLFREMAQNSDIKGYMRSHYYAEPDTKHRISCKIHRLVAEAFVPNPDNKPQVNHIDGNKANNHYTNLEWVNNSENIQHAYDNNLIDRSKKRLLNDETILTIRKLYTPNDREFGTRGLGRKFNVSPACISYCINKVKLETEVMPICIATVA